MARTALIVVDMQNSFLHPEGENYYPAAPEVIEPVRALISAAEAGGSIIVHVCDRHREGFADFEQPRLPQHCVVGGISAEFFEGFGPQGRAREILITKRRYSAFFATELALFLNEQDSPVRPIGTRRSYVDVHLAAADDDADSTVVVYRRRPTADIELQHDLIGISTIFGIGISLLIEGALILVISLASAKPETRPLEGKETS